MWKCFNRGVLETIDRSVNLFKADTSSGTCLISSLAKDLDGVSEEPIRNKSQQFSQDEDGTSLETADHSLRRVHSAQTRKLPWAFKIRGHARTSQTQQQDQSNLKPFKGRTSFDVIEKPFICGGVEKKPTGGHLTPDLAYSCVNRTLSGKCESVCSCRRNPSHDLDYISETKYAEDGCFVYQNDSNESRVCRKRHSKSLRERAIFLEGQKYLESFLGVQDAGSCKGNIFSQLKKRTLSDSQQQSRENKDIAHEEISPQELAPSNSKSNCVLKLPFLCYDLGKFKGLSNISVGWLQNSRGDFKRGDGGKSEGEHNGESEESKEDAWRDCQIHQSFLEAVGWSSAVLFGWFLGQYRFSNIHGELKRDSLSENKRKCCIMRSLTNFMVTWRGDSVLPLKILPSKTADVPKEDRKEQHRKIYVGETNSTFDPYDACSPNPFTVLDNEDGGISGRPTPKSHFKLLKNEVANSHQGNLNMNLHAVNQVQKNVIPMPWHEDSNERLMYGPITLEEAFKEAGKGLEEAQSEVLLAQALQKLDEGSSSSHNDPLPVDLFQSSASLGNTSAAFNLGICYEKGVGGVVKNLSQAYHWYKRASDKGHAAATYNLAIFHANGLGGLQPDTKLANQLLLKASSLGLEEASSALQLLSSISASEVCSRDRGCSSPDHQDSFNMGFQESSHPPKNNSSTASSSMTVKNMQDFGSVYCENYSLRSNDLTTGTFSRSLQYFAKLSKLSSLQFGEALQNSMVVNSADTSESSMEEVVFDHHSLKTGHVDSTSVQLLAH